MKAINAGQKQSDKYALLSSYDFGQTKNIETNNLWNRILGTDEED